MVNNLLDRDISNSPLLANKVVIMEDDFMIQEHIFNFMENNLKWEVIKCDDQNEAVDIARNKQAAFFILDNRVGDSKQEGLDALERIKSIDKTIFVAIFTAYSVKRREAENLDCNLFVEKNRLQLNLLHIVDEMLKYRLQIVDNVSLENSKQLEDIKRLKKEIIKQLKFVERLEDTYNKKSSSPKYQQDRNRKAYEKCELDKKWLKENQGKYAAFVDGEFKFSCKDRDEFFNRLINSDEYKEKQIFFAEVGEKKRIIDEPTSLWFELI